MARTIRSIDQAGSELRRIMDARSEAQRMMTTFKRQAVAALNEGRAREAASYVQMMQTWQTRYEVQTASLANLTEALGPALAQAQRTQAYLSTPVAQAVAR